MSDSDRYIRSSSGLWTLTESAKMGSSTTPSRGLAAAPRDRATSFAELARADFAKGNLTSAETNYRLATTFAPNDPRLRAELRKVVEARDALRRSALKPSRK